MLLVRDRQPAARKPLLPAGVVFSSVLLVPDANEPAGQIGRRFASQLFRSKLFCVTPDAK